MRRIRLHQKFMLTSVMTLALGSLAAIEANATHLWHGVPLKGSTQGTFNVVIEIAEGSNQKFEVDHESGAIKLDRMLKGGYRYPAKYGYFPRTLGGDGDAMDVLVVGGEKRAPGEQMTVRVVGKMKMVDSGEEDTKIIAVPAGPAYSKIRDIGDLAAEEKARIASFFRNYKKPEHKTVTVGRFSKRAGAMVELQKSVKTYNAKFGSAMR